jgi:hypothetical protein
VTVLGHVIADSDDLAGSWSRRERRDDAGTSPH